MVPSTAIKHDWFYLILIVFPSKRLNASIWPTDETLICTETPGQNWPESNSGEKLAVILQIPIYQMGFSIIPDWFIDWFQRHVNSLRVILCLENRESCSLQWKGTRNRALALNNPPMLVVIYQAFCLDVAQNRMNGALNETRTHSCRLASQTY